MDWIRKLNIKGKLLTLLGSCLLAFIFTLPTQAKSLLKEGAIEFEQLRLRQLQTVQEAGEIVPFVTDGCSGYQSQNWGRLAQVLPGFEKHFGARPPWEACCVTHDRAYWRGDVIDGYAKRKKADELLKQCVIDTGIKLAPKLGPKYSVSEATVRNIFSVTAELMYQAVRLGGLPCSLLPWRWGYGWDYCAFSAIDIKPDSYSDLKDDEHLIFFNTAAWLDEDGQHWNIPIHAWVYEPQRSIFRVKSFAKVLAVKYGLEITPQTEDNFKYRANLLISDNERGKQVVIRIAGMDVSLTVSESNGHIYQVLKLPKEVVRAFSNQGRLRYIAVMHPDDRRRFEGELKLVPKIGISVISDIDDTVKISEITDRRKLLRNTFFDDFREAPGMGELYRSLSAQGLTFHFVSSSPWQLYTPLQHLLTDSNFPWATMSLKQVRFRDKSLLNLFKKGTETKPGQIEPILKRYPKRKFILIGDSGEQDPEVYGEIARQYPSQVIRIWIRNVDHSDAKDDRYKQAFRDVEKKKWQLFKHPDRITIGNFEN